MQRSRYGPYGTIAMRRWRAIGSRPKGIYRATTTRRYRYPNRRQYYNQGARIQRAIGSQGVQEIKSFDCTPIDFDVTGVMGVAGAEPAAMAGMCEINDVQAGNTFYQRIGTKICVKSILCRFRVFNSHVTATGAWTDEAGLVRYMIIYDRQTNAAFPAITDILQDNDTGAATQGSSINIANRDRFMVLRDKQVELDSGGQNSVWINEYIKCPNLDVQFKASAGTIGDITTGAIYLLIFGYLPLGATLTTGQAVNLVTRIRYRD